MWWEIKDGGVTNDGDDDKALFGGISSFVLELPLGSSSLLLSRWNSLRLNELGWTWMRLGSMKMKSVKLTVKWCLQYSLQCNDACSVA